MNPPPGGPSGDPPDPARGWVEHLRAGGTTPWLTWLGLPHQGEGGAGPDAGAARAASHPDAGPCDVLPGAAQLELVRRLAERAVRDERFTALADRALERPGPGRGRSERPLPRPDLPGSAHPTGVPAVDPSTLPADELIRPAVGLLADLLLDDPGSPSGGRRPRGAPIRWPWRRSFRLVGAPATVASVRAALAAAGQVEGGRRPEVVLLAEPLDVHLAQAWAARVERGAPVRWRTFVTRCAQRDELPSTADLARTAASWAERVGPERVHVVAGPDPRRTTAAVLRLRGAGPPVADGRGLSPTAVDLLRRLNAVLNVRVPADGRDPARARAAALLRELDAPVPPRISVPDRHRPWLDARAEAITDRLRRGGYPVHGDLDRIAPRHRGRSHPYRPDVLALVLDGCLKLAGLRREGK